MPRAKGMGSVRRRQDGRYEARYTDPRGLQRSIYGATSREVTTKLRAALAAMDNATWTPPTRLTVADWLDTWLTDYCCHVRPTTMNVYVNTARRIIQHIGDVPLTRLNQSHLRHLQAGLTSGGYAPSTINTTITMLESALNDAVESHIIPANPVTGSKRLPEEQAAMHIIDRPLIPAFLDACDNHRYGPELKFLFFTGLRFGELAGLTWDCVNLSRAELTVRQQHNSYTPDGSLDPTKSGLSRVIQLTPQAMAILAAQHTRLANLQRLSATPWPTCVPQCDLVFRSIHGDFLPSGTIYNACAAIGKAIGLPGLHPHDLRHSYAVAALRSGADPKTVQHNLGHASAAMTLDVYARYTSDSGLVAAQRLSDYLTAAQ